MARRSRAHNTFRVSPIELLLGVCVGVGLSSACGFRIFLPLLLVGIGQRYDVPALSSMPDWVGSTPALVILGGASVAEIAAYYIPWFDNLMDTIASPAAVLAGVLVFAGVNSELDPIWRWSLAIIAGGGAAGMTQTTTVLARAVSTGATGGVTNPLLSTVEAVMATLTTLLVFVFAPIALVAMIGGVWWLLRLRRQRQVSPQPTAS